MSSPIIGMTMHKIGREVRLNHDYIQSIVQAGGIPFLIPYFLDQKALDEVAQKIDGLVLTGGEDIDPAYYEEDPHPKLERIAPERDELELNLLKRVIKQRKPILAICRGMQLLNVGMGGDLYQDIPSQTEKPILHRQEAPRGYPFHAVTLQKGSKLQQIMGETRIKTNTYHHQAVRKVKRPFTACAWTSDGIVEAIESTEHPFIIGVQWHPECMAVEGDQYSKKLFQAFVQACQESGLRKKEVMMT